MNPPATSRSRWWKILLITAVVVVTCVVFGLWYTTTQSFQNYVRRRLVAEVERITGGRAEVGSFHVVPFHLQVEVRNITVHGKEAPGDIPLAHAESLVAQLKINSLLRSDFGFRSLVLERPVIHISIGPDGATTNIPAMKVLPQGTGTEGLERLFALSINHLSVRNGMLLWADQKVPLNFTVDGTNLQMDYSFLRGRYESHLELGKVETTLQNYRPFSWMTTIDFSLGSTSADIRSLRWNSGRSSFAMNGRISDFRNPRIDASYQAHVNLGEAAAIVRRTELREGTADFKGDGHWSLSDFSTNGSIALKDLGWQDDQFVVKNTNAFADYSLTEDQFKLQKLQGKLLGGTFTGDAQVDNWLHSIPPPRSGTKREEQPVIGVARPPARKGARAKPAGVQSGLVRLRLRDVSVAETAVALDVPAHRMFGFKPAGMANGTMEAVWKETPGNAEMAFTFDVNPPVRPAARELPITARVQGKYRGANDSLELTQFNLTTPSSKVAAEGLLAASSRLRFSVSTSDLEEWRPLVKALGGPTDLPFRVDGEAAFNGTLAGTFSAPTLAGTLVAEDFEFTVPATSRTPEKAVHWDSLAASIQLSSHELSLRGGSLRRGDTSADFELVAALQQGQFTENSPYTARVNLHNVDVASTAALAGFDYPISGTATVALLVSGTRAHPQAQGHIHAVDASAYGEAIEDFEADLHIGTSETALNNIRLTHEAAVVTGSAAYTPANESFRLDLSGKDFDLSRIRQIHLDELPIEGRGDFTLQATGTANSPVINAQLQVHDLTLDREPAGEVDIQATTQNGQLVVSGQSHLLKGTLTVDGTIGLHGDFPANIAAHTDHVDLDALWRAYLGQQLTGHSSVTGVMTMQGPLFRPSQWKLAGEATGLSIDVEYAKLHNEGSARFTYADRVLHIEEAHFVGDGTDVVGHGWIYYAEGRRLDFVANGHADLRFFSLIDPNITATGQMLIHATMVGSVRDPQPQGTITIENGTVNYANLPIGLSDLNGSLAFTRNQLHIEQLTARTGGGTLDLKGDAGNYNQQLNFNLTAIGKDVRLRYPPGVSSTATAELHWVGTKSASLVSGDILVTKLAVTPGFDFGSYLERSRQSAGVTPATSPLNNVKLDVSVRTAPELQMKTSVARLSGNADLRLRGSAARPSVLGRVDILEGDATFNGIKFRLERGDVTFANPVAIEPQVNLQATTHVRNYDLDVTVTGTAERLNVNYRSEPPLPKSDIIALLALGRTSQESEQLQQQSGQALFTDEATNLIINQALNSTVNNRMQKLFGVSRIKIDPQGLTTETNPTGRGPQITIEQEFANNLSLSYSTNVAQSSQQIIQGEYFFTRNISVVGTRDQNGVVSFDLRVRRRKK